MADLPEILAGPILRRADPERVCVWLATKRKLKVQGFVYEAKGLQSIGQGEAVSLRLGANLHVTLVEIRPVSTDESPPKPYPRGMTLAYDLVLRLVNDATDEAVIGSEAKLSEHSEVRSGLGIAYPPFRLPTFVLCDGETLNLLHGSCRKPHGDGEDALAIADSLLEHAVARNKIAERPSVLLLTGDQIYADDVDTGLIKVITELGRILLGRSETIPLMRGGSLEIPTLKEEGIRGQLIRHVFTPDDRDDRKKSVGKNHLLGFGDFAAMYLLAWNPGIWPAKIPNGDKRLEGMKSALPAVRRALANISTYMIFDDHEITDDWNITASWARHAQSDRVGRRVLANGLAAYWCFQAWGNVPGEEVFPEAFRQILEDYLGNGNTEKADAYERALLEPDSKRQWSFTAPTIPPVVFLDSRTRREVSQVRDTMPSALLDRESLDELVREAEQLALKHRRLILVAPSPILGNPLAEEFLESHGASDPLTYDLETWHCNRAGFYSVLDAIATIEPEHCLILSGDVHYAFVAIGSVETRGKRIPITQFTSSALKNGPSGRAGFGAGLTSDASRGYASREYGWREGHPLVRQDAARADRDLAMHLRTTPTVLTIPECVRANFDPTGADMFILNGPIPALTPTSSPILLTRSNIGQVLLSRESDAFLRLIEGGGSRTVYTYHVDMGPGAELSPRIQMNEDRPTSGETVERSHARLRQYAWQHEARLLMLTEKAGVKLDRFVEGQGTVVYDEYRSTVSAMPRGTSPQALLRALAIDLNGTIRSKSFDDVNVFHRRAAGGEPGVGDIYFIDIHGPDNGSVMLVDRRETYFVFHTITGGADLGGRHPERGVREFGFMRYGDGRVTFYTRGVSRPESLVSRVVGRSIQRKGWLALVNGIGAEVQRRGGKWNPSLTQESRWEE